MNKTQYMEELHKQNLIINDLLGALVKIEAALRVDAREKSILADTVEYHLDGQVMYMAINAARDAIARARV